MLGNYIWSWTFYYFLAVSLILFLELLRLMAEASQQVVIGFGGLRNAFLVCIAIYHIFPLVTVSYIYLTALLVLDDK